MRVLFVDTPVPTTFLPMVPLGWALRTAGHEVRFASQPDFTGTITQAGLTAVPVGRDSDMLRLMFLAMEELEIAPGLSPPLDVVEHPERAVWDRMLPLYTETVEAEYRTENFPIIAGLVEFARAWEPDLIIWENSTFAGAIAAKACGAAHARLLGRIDTFGVMRQHFLRLKAEQPADKQVDPLADWLNGYGRKYGFEFTEDMATGQFTIDQLPGTLRREADLDYVPMQFIPYGGPAVVPSWLGARPERPRVALTLGLGPDDELDDYHCDVQGVLDSLGELDIDLVVTIAEKAQHQLARVPGNARLVSYVPLHALAATCSVVINHAGAGTFLTIARHGVPQLTLPWDEDEPELARLATAQGGSLSIPGDEATGPAVRDAVQLLLKEPSFGERAAALRDEIHDMPTPNQVVAQLEELTTVHRTR